MTKRSTAWRAVIRARNPETGEVVAENDILAGGITMTLELWNGDTTERFDSLRLENAFQNEIQTEVASRSYQTDTSGADPLGIFTSTALFASADVDEQVEFVSLIGSSGTVIGRAPLQLDSGFAYEVEREDYLGEADSVIPAT